MVSSVWAHATRMRNKRRDTPCSLHFLEFLATIAKEEVDFIFARHQHLCSLNLERDVRDVYWQLQSPEIGSFARYKTWEGTKCVLGAWRAPYGPMLYTYYPLGVSQQKLTWINSYMVSFLRRWIWWPKSSTTRQSFSDPKPSLFLATFLAPHFPQWIG